MEKSSDIAFTEELVMSWLKGEIESPGEPEFHLLPSQEEIDHSQSTSRLLTLIHECNNIDILEQMLIQFQIDKEDLLAETTRIKIDQLQIELEANYLRKKRFWQTINWIVYVSLHGTIFLAGETILSLLITPIHWAVDYASNLWESYTTRELSHRHNELLWDDNFVDR